MKRVQELRVDESSRRKLIEDRDTILELTSKKQEIQNEMKDFQDAESVRSRHSHVSSQPVSFPTHPIPGGMLSRSIGMPSRKDGPPSIWDTHCISGNVFCKSSRVFFSTLPAGFESMEFSYIGANSLITGGEE